MPGIEFRGIGKRFPGVVALSGVTFSVRPGSCHALIGENGAGKSTLGKILGGIHSADEGEIALDGRVVNLASPAQARKEGIAMVHQELVFCPELSVAENLCLSDPPRTRWGTVDFRRMRQRARAMLDAIEAPIDVDAPIGTLGTAKEQLVQIAGAVGGAATTIVMDEPTSSLSAGETEELYRLVRRLTARGVTIIYVSHRLRELFDLCDTITVLRDGCHVATEPVTATDPDRLIRQMIGRNLDAWQPGHLGQPPGRERLRVAGFSSPGAFANVDLTLRAGEIVGLAGLVGAGRTALARALFGLDPDAAGDVRVDGRPAALRSVAQARRCGIGLIPEDRKREGLVMPMSARANASLAALAGMARWGWIRGGEERARTGALARQLGVRAGALDGLVSALSGGNQQKIVLAKWLATGSSILLVDEPTRGVDVGAKREIHRALDELAKAGVALLVISSELPELIALCGRVLVMREGRLVGELPRADCTEESLLRLMSRPAA